MVIIHLFIFRIYLKIDVDGVEQSKMQYDSTGMFHWCPSRDIDASLMDRQDAAMTVLQVLEWINVFLVGLIPLIVV